MRMHVTAHTSTSAADPVAWLVHDHQVIRGYLDTLRRGNLGDDRPTLEALKKLLALHNAIEENLVYPALAKLVGREDQAMELFHETAEADLLVFTLSQAAEQDDETAFKATLTDLIAAISDHVELEETRAFPALQAAPPGVQQHLANQILQFKTAVTTPI
jgi:hemerythrin superfamily protein